MSDENRAADSPELLDEIDAVLDASFPASDPPPWTLGYGPLVPTPPRGDDRPTTSTGSPEPRVGDAVVGACSEPADGSSVEPNRRAGGSRCW